MPSAAATSARSGLRVRPGEQDPDDLGGLADRPRIGLGILLVSLLIGRETQVGRELADLAEPFGAFSGRDVLAGEGVGDGPDQVRVQAAEPRVGGVGDQLEQLRKEVSVDGAEVRPLPQVLTRIGGRPRARWPGPAAPAAARPPGSARGRGRTGAPR